MFSDFDSVIMPLISRIIF